MRTSVATLVLMLIVLAALGVASHGLRAFAQQPPVEETPAEPDEQPRGDTDSAQAIEDDPTIAPDPESSADNNVTFPIDI